jgi:hypothetical protein
MPANSTCCERMGIFQHCDYPRTTANLSHCDVTEILRPANYSHATANPPQCGVMGILCPANYLQTDANTSDSDVLGIFHRTHYLQTDANAVKPVIGIKSGNHITCLWSHSVLSTTSEPRTNHKHGQAEFQPTDIATNIATNSPQTIHRHSQQIPNSPPAHTNTNKPTSNTKRRIQTAKPFGCARRINSNYLDPAVQLISANQL